MGIFTRFRDIVGSNLTAILDRAEDPEKMIRMMILEMEDTLIEIKSSCAGVIADQKKVERQMRESQIQAKEWEKKAKLALTKEREDLARAAVVEKRHYEDRAEGLERELGRLKETVSSFQNDIEQLEAKLTDAREKQRSILARRQAVEAKFRAQTRIREVDTSEAFMKFEAYENNIDRMEAEAGLINGHRKNKPSLSDQFADLERSEEIEGELDRLRSELNKGA